jgi:hypothetical protein
MQRPHRSLEHEVSLYDLCVILMASSRRTCVETVSLEQAALVIEGRRGQIRAAQPLTDSAV